MASNRQLNNVTSSGSKSSGTKVCTVKNEDRKTQNNGYVLSKQLPDSGASSSSPADDGKCKSVATVGEAKGGVQGLETSETLPEEILKISRVMTDNILIDREVNRFYQAIGPANIHQASSIRNALNIIDQGDGYSQRTGTQIDALSLAVNFHITMDNSTPDGLTAATVYANDLYANMVRILIFEDKMPIIGNPTYFSTTNPPNSQTDVLTVPGYPTPTSTGSDAIALWNPMTVPARYNIMYDETFDVNKVMVAPIYYNTSTSLATGSQHKYCSHTKHLVFNLKGKRIQWYDQGNASAIINCKYYFMAITNIITGGVLPRVSAISELRYKQ